MTKINTFFVTNPKDSELGLLRDTITHANNFFIFTYHNYN